MISNRRYFFSANGESKGSTNPTEESLIVPKELDIVHRLRPVIMFFNVFGLIPFRLPSSSRISIGRPACFRMWTSRVIQLGYTFAIVCVMTAFFVLQTSEYRMKVSEERPCANAACIVRKLPGPVFSSVVCFVCIYTNLAFRHFDRVLVRWNDVIVRMQRCFSRSSNAAQSATIQYHASRTTLILLVAIYYGFAFLEHGLGTGQTALNCIQTMGDKCDIFKFTWDTIAHRNSSLARHDTGSLNVIIFVATKYGLIVWNMSDCLVMVFGLCLATNLDAFNRQLRVFAMMTPRRTNHEWRAVRNVHMALCDLLGRIDDVLSPAILATTFVVCFFICQQIFFHLFAVLKLFSSCESCAPYRKLRIAYGVTSFLHLAFRITGVCIIGSKVVDGVKFPLEVLREYRTEETAETNIEVNRFWDHVTDTKAAFTAMKLFTIDRSLLLKIVGIFITYEMLFLSFCKED